MKYFELNHVIEDGMITFKGLPGPKVTEFLTREESRKNYSEGVEFTISKVEMVANTGTYIDTPYHRYADGKELAEMQLDCLANLDGLVVKVERGVKKIDASFFRDLDLKGKAVLIHTGWDRYWNTDKYFSDHPYLTKDAAEFLADSKVKLVGIDSYNIDDSNDGTRPVHSILLGSEIPIIEHMCGLDQLPKSGFRFFAVPQRIRNVASFPVRAFAIVE